VKNLLKYLVMAVTLLTLAACGGGGGGGGGDATIQAASKATVKIFLTGGTISTPAISGADVTLILPDKVTPGAGADLKYGVTNSGILAGSNVPPTVDYTAATATNQGTLRVILTSSALNGDLVNGEVEVATISSVLLAPGAAATFDTIRTVSVYDKLGNPINGLGAIVRVQSVTPL